MRNNITAIGTETLTRSELIDTKEYLQSINTDILGNLTIMEIKECIKNALRIILIERGEFGYTAEELAFYLSLRYKPLYNYKSKNYVIIQINDMVKNTKYIETTQILVFDKAQKKYRVAKDAFD